MIFYFSGTGNSLYAAKQIAREQGEGLVSISAAVNGGGGPYTYDLRDDERIGFVCPVYAWGPPQMVLDFIGKLKLNGYQDHYTFAVITCGGTIGNTVKVLDRALKRRGMRLDSGFSLKMPNNYMIMGDVDTQEAVEEILSAAEGTLKEINRAIREKTAGVFRLSRGPLPWLLTGLMNLLFSKSIDTAKFTVDDSCTGCGICERVCNCRTINVTDKPRWGRACSQCLGCINYCPEKAIQYGKTTVGKGRYVNPRISLEEMSCGN